MLYSCGPGLFDRCEHVIHAAETCRLKTVKAYSGVFHLLPLGLRVQEKIERLIDKHMLRLGIALALLLPPPRLTTQVPVNYHSHPSPPKHYGRNRGDSMETATRRYSRHIPHRIKSTTHQSVKLLRLNARSGPGFMLSPTHEEEITTLVASTLKSYKELPIRLYQVSTY